MSKRNDTPPPEASKTFEIALGELEEAINQLEAGELPLEESLKLFEKGVASLKTCHTILDKAEKRIRVLVKGANGQPALADAGVAELRESGVTLNSKEPRTPVIGQPPVLESRAPASGQPPPQEDSEAGLW